MDYFAVIRTQFEPVNPNLLREVLIDPGGLPKIDAAQLARRSQGIVGERFTAAQAQVIVQTLNNMGFAFQLMPASNLQTLTKGRSIPWLAIEEAGMLVPIDYHDTTVQIPWSSIFVVSAGHVSQVEEQRQIVQTQIDQNGIPKVEEQVKRRSKKTHTTEIIAVTINGDFTHLRLAPQDLASNRVQPVPTAPTAFLKYLEVLGQIVARATHAVVSPETRAILNKQKEDTETFDGDAKALAESRAFRDGYNRWLLQIAVLQEMSRQKGES